MGISVFSRVRVSGHVTSKQRPELWATRLDRLQLRRRLGAFRGNLSRSDARAQVVTLCFAALLIAPVGMAEAGTAVGRIAGDFGVSNSGAANYSIPINVPAGRNGLRPSVALTYSSQRGAGLAGVGWHLAGFSTITRCGKILAVDGERTGVNYDGDDRFCLDGQLLILRSGTYGANGATYRPEIHNYELVTSHGSVGSHSPDWFEVKMRNGLIYRYGNDGNSQMVAPGTGGEVDTWALNEIRDTVGNTILFGYYESTGDFEFVPTEIKWTAGNGNSTPLYKLRFDYHDRTSGGDKPDVRRGYRAGVAWERTKRLHKISYQHHNGSAYTDVHVYTLAYSSQGNTGAATGRSQLISVTQCEFLTTGQDCLPATDITYQAPGTDGWQSMTGTGGASVANFNGATFADYDGDGDSDIFWPNTTGKWSVLFSDNNYISAPIDSTASHNGNAGFSLDYNGDGRKDLLTKQGSTWRVLQSKGLGLQAAFTLRDTGIPTNVVSTPHILDINGDGLSDLVYINTSSGNVEYYINNGDQTLGNSAYTGAPGVKAIGGGGCAGISLAFQVQQDGIQTPDFNGDGRDDLLVIRNGCSGVWDKWLAFHSTGAGFSSEVGSIDSSEAMAITDINGDGLSDLLGNSSGNKWIYRLSNGAGFEPVVTTDIDVPAPHIAGEPIYAVDYQRDGRLDLLQQNGTQWRVYLADDAGYTSANYVDIGGPSPATATLSPADLDGSGHTDLMVADSTDNKWKFRRQAFTAQRDLLDKTTDGLGNTFEPVYAAMNSSTHSATGSPSAPNSRHATRGPHIVKSYQSNDGIGGDYMVTYQYTGGLLNTQGRGFLGFEQIERTDNRDDLRHFSEFEQAFPFMGRLKLARTKQPTGSNDLQFTDPSWTVYTGDPTGVTKPASEPGELQFVHRTSQSDKTYEVNGTLTRQVDQDFTPSGFNFNYTHGQPSKTVQTVTSNVAAWSGKTWTVETTVNYDNSIAANKNCRGYPTAVTVKRTNDTPENESRVQNRSYNSNCQLLTQVQGGINDPTSARLKTTYGYVSGGKLDSVTRDAENGSLPDRRVNLGWDTRGYRVTSETYLIDSQPSLVIGKDWNYQLGLQASQADPRAQNTVWSYDGFGRLIAQTVPGAANSVITYTDCVSCFPSHAVYEVSTVLSGGTFSRSFFDRYGRVVGRENLLVDGDYSRQQLSYNARGQLVTEQVPYIGSSVASTSYVYNDVLGRVTKIISPAHDGGNAETLYAYSPLRVTVTDAEDHVTQQDTDPLGQVYQVDPPLVGATTYGYRPFGELATVTDPGGSAAIKTWTYDGLGNPETYVDVNSGTWTYDYNVFGELVSQTDDQSPANVITASYDQLGRITQRVEPTLGLLQGNTTTWTYETSATANGFGLIRFINGPTDLSASGYQETYTYAEPYGRPSRIGMRIENVTHNTDYGYDNNTGELTELTYPASDWNIRHKIIYDYTYGYLDRVQWNDSVNTHDIYDVVDADPLGRPTDIGWGPFGASSHTTAYNYHAASLQLEGIQTSGTGSNDVQDYSYTWDKVGNLETRQDHNQSGLTESFGYDDLNRLIQVDLSTETNPTLVMTYTGNGNILTKTGITAGAGVYQYGQNGAGPHAVTGISQAATDYNHYSSFHYDANGNMDCRGATTSACSGGDPVSWYAFNKPQQITRGSDSASFVYGPNRGRIKQKRVAGTKTLNIDYAGNHFEREKVDNKIRWRLNVYAYGELIYWIQEYRIQNTCSVTTGSDSYFVLKDHLGSVDQTVHDQGSGSGEQHSYDAFGLRRDVAGWADDADYSQLTTDEQLDRGYTEHEHLDNVRAIHMNGRVQDPIIGRMLSVDPVVGSPGNQTINGYSYVGNNPMRFVDPTGYLPNVTVTAPAPSGGSSSPGTVFTNSGPAFNAGYIPNVISPDLEAAYQAYLADKKSEEQEGDDNSLLTPGELERLEDLERDTRACRSNPSCDFAYINQEDATLLGKVEFILAAAGDHQSSGESQYYYHDKFDFIATDMKPIGMEIESREGIVGEIRGRLIDVITSVTSGFSVESGRRLFNKVDTYEHYIQWYRATTHESLGRAPSQRIDIVDWNGTFVPGYRYDGSGVYSRPVPVINGIPFE